MSPFLRVAVWRGRCAAFLLLLLCLVPVSAQDEGRTRREKSAQQTGAGQESRTSQTSRNAAPAAAPDVPAVLAFAEQHHPELGKLLRQLRRAESPEFDRAMRELSQQVTRIERVRERAPARFEFELEAWKLDSQIRLLAARWVMSRDPALEQQIRRLLATRQSHRMANLRRERQRLEQRLQQVNNQLSDLTADPEARLESEFTRLTRKAKASRSAAGRRSRTAAQRKSEGAGNSAEPAKRGKKPQEQHDQER